MFVIDIIDNEVKDNEQIIVLIKVFFSHVPFENVFHQDYFYLCEFLKKAKNEKDYFEIKHKANLFFSSYRLSINNS